jgi:hypothetical protein
MTPQKEEISNKAAQSIKEEMPSDKIPDAHAAGDGAMGRSKEVITEEDIHPEKDENEDAPPSY